MSVALNKAWRLVVSFHQDLWTVLEMLGITIDALSGEYRGTATVH